MKKFLLVSIALLFTACSQPNQQSYTVITNSFEIEQDGVVYIFWIGLGNSGEDMGGIYTVPWWDGHKSGIRNFDIFKVHKRAKDNGWVLDSRLNANR